MSGATTTIRVTLNSVNYLFDQEGDAAELARRPDQEVFPGKKGPDEDDVVAVVVDLEKYYISTFHGDEHHDGFNRPEGPCDRVRLVPKYELKDPPNEM